MYCSGSADNRSLNKLLNILPIYIIGHLYIELCGGIIKVRIGFDQIGGLDIPRGKHGSENRFKMECKVRAVIIFRHGLHHTGQQYKQYYTYS